MRILLGMFIASLLYIAAYMYVPQLLNRLLSRGDNTVWGDLPKQPVYRQMGARIYTTDLNGAGIRREADGADVDVLVAGGRKVFTTKGEAG